MVLTVSGRRWLWIGEVRLGNWIGHGPAIDIRQDRTPLSAELYQIILDHTLSRREVQRNISIVPALPARPVVPALGTLSWIAGFGNQENARFGEVGVRRASPPESVKIALLRARVVIRILGSAGADPTRRVGSSVRILARGIAQPEHRATPLFRGLRPGYPEDAVNVN